MRLTRTFIEPNTGYHIAKRYQEKCYTTGAALLGHRLNAHRGKSDKECPACAEIKKKMRALSEAQCA